MNKEEQEAIERIKQEIDRYKAIEMPKDVYITNIKTLLIIVKRQQKEIEELKKWDNVFLEMYIHKDKVGANYISKDTIREKIKEIENRRIEEGKCELAIYGFQRDAKIEVLQELLDDKKLIEKIKEIHNEGTFDAEIVLTKLLEEK